MKTPPPSLDWSPLATAPLGIPIQVRNGDQITTAIRDEYLGWFNEDRSGGIDFLPLEWAAAGVS